MNCVTLVLGWFLEIRRRPLQADHGLLFSTLRASGFVGVFLSLLGLLFRDACCLVTVGGGLSSPVTAQTGIRQGCPLFWLF